MDTTQQRAVFEKEINTADHKEVLEQIWTRTIGAKGNKVPDSRAYTLIDVRRQPAMTNNERMLQSQMLSSQGVSVNPSMINRHQKVITSPYSILNHFAITVKFQGQKAADITLYHGLEPESNTKPSEWKIARHMTLGPAMVSSDPDKTMYCDIHFSCKESPLHWYEEKLKDCGIEYIRLKNPDLNKIRYQWADTVTSENGESINDLKFDILEVQREIVSLPYGAREAMCMKLIGVDSLRGLNHKTKNRDMIVMLCDFAATYPDLVKRHLVGAFPVFFESLRNAEIHGIIKVQGGQWMMLSGAGNDSDFVAIDDSFIPTHHSKEPVLFLANLLYGKEGKPGVKLDTAKSIVRITKEKLDPSSNKPSKEDVSAVASETTIDIDAYRIALEKAFDDGDIMIDFKAKRAYFNPKKDGDQDENLLGGFRDPGEKEDNRVELIRKAIIDKYIDDPAKRAKIIKRLGLE